MACPTALAARSPSGLEYLPVTIFDHRRVALPEPAFVIHPIEPVDCIDLSRSRLEWSVSDPTAIEEVDHLELDASKVPASRLLFRAGALKRSVIVRRELMLEIEQAGFTGVGWKKIA